MTPADAAFHRYRTDRSDDAFREVVAAHLPMVYSTALRIGGNDAAEAEDVSQMVFADLARKAPALREDAAVGAWLHRHTCFLMKSTIRSHSRRRTREQAAAAPAVTSPSVVSEEEWSAMESRLDHGLESLREADRRVLVLRFFEGRNLRDVGAALGIGDDAAQKRVSRALDRLRSLITGPRAALSSASLAAAMTARVRCEVPGSVSASLARSALQLAGARTGSLAASGGTAAVSAAWTGVVATAAVAVWLAWPHWHAATAAEAHAGLREEGILTKRAEAIRGGAVSAPEGGKKNAGAGVEAAIREEAGGQDPVKGNAVAGSGKSVKDKTPVEKGREAASKASTMHKWMVAYALDHGGAFPPDLSALLSGTNFGFPVDQTAEWLRPVIEYRGRKLTSSDPGKMLLMRYRVPDSTDQEVRLFVTGSCAVFPVDEPLPEDEAQAPPASGPGEAKAPQQP